MKGKWTLGMVIELIVAIAQIAWVIFLIGLFIYNWRLGFIVGILWLFVDWMRKPMTITITKKKRR